MFGRIILLALGSMAIMVTSFCVHKNGNSRHVSSGGGIPQVDQVITVPVDGGHKWIITKNSLEEPAGVVDLLVYFQCEGDSDPTLFDSPLRVSSYPQGPGISKAYSWGDLKGKPTYKRHEADKLNQDIKSVVVIQFYPVPEVNMKKGEDQTPDNANTSKQVVLDMANGVCPY